jgi:hypothetical protein
MDIQTIKEERILICKHLLNDANLFQVYHNFSFSPEIVSKWLITCNGQHCIDEDFVEIKMAEACERFPEINELLDIPDDMEVMFQKGNNSGKWYDFHPS